MKGVQNWSLQTKLVLAFAAMVIINVSVSLYYTSQVREMMRFNQATQNVYYNVKSIYNALQEANRQIGIYVENPSAETLASYVQARNMAIRKIAGLTNQRDSDKEWFIIHAIRNSTDTMFAQYDETVQKLEAGQIGFYLDYYNGYRIFKYIPGYISEYLNLLVEANSQETQILEQKTAVADRLSKILLLGSSIACLAFAVAFSNLVTKPIRGLSEAAQRISKGELGVPDVPVVNDDELGALTKTFNVMKDDITIAIETLLQRAELEGRLHEEELKNVKNAELLKEAMYLALQSQINPHFLFNALNAISRAITHEPKETATALVCSLADLFRYNLDHLNTYSTLGEELNVVSKYIYIQKHRFEDRIQYRVDGSEQWRKALVPSMLVQPLVENSLIHGIENLEHGGMILVKVSCKSNVLRLRVYDNGSGMDRMTRKSVCAGDLGDHTGHTGHITGIGLSNITNRLQLIPGSRIRLNSELGKGTLVDIRIPLRLQEEEDNV